MHVTYVIDSLVEGGAERSLAAMVPFYTSAGIDLDVVYLKDRPGLQVEFENAGASLFCVEGAGGRIGWTQRIARLLQRRRPDLVHTTLFEADVCGRSAAFLTGVRAVTSLVNVQYGPEHFGDPQIKSWRLRAAQMLDVTTARKATRLHALTDNVADVMAHRLMVPRDRIDVIPRGRDGQALGSRTSERSARVRESLDVTPNTPLVLAAARHEFQKGLDVLLEAWPRVQDSIPHARLVVAGREGNFSPRLRALIRELDLGGGVRLLGSRRDVPDLMVAADAFVLPSRWEGFGSVLLEAMALGTPVVASDLPPVQEVLDTCGRLVPPGDSLALAGALIDVLRERETSLDRARRAKERFEDRFAMDRVARQMVDFYEYALEAKGKLSSGRVA